jgi:hypothetical protein
VCAYKGLSGVKKIACVCKGKRRVDVRRAKRRERWRAVESGRRKIRKESKMERI